MRPITAQNPRAQPEPVVLPRGRGSPLGDHGPAGAHCSPLARRHTVRLGVPAGLVRTRRGVQRAALRSPSTAPSRPDPYWHGHLRQRRPARCGHEEVAPADAARRCAYTGSCCPTGSGSSTPAIPKLFAPATTSRSGPGRAGTAPRHCASARNCCPTGSESSAPATPTPWHPQQHRVLDLPEPGSPGSDGVERLVGRAPAVSPVQSVLSGHPRVASAQAERPERPGQPTFNPWVRIRAGWP